MKKIEINGRKYAITCNMKALVSYQRITGHNPLDMEHITDEQRAMYDITIGWCMLEASNKDVPDIEELMSGIDSIQKQVEFSTAVAEEMQRYYGLKPGDSDQTDRHDIDTEDEDEDDKDKYEKNA